MARRTLLAMGLLTLAAAWLTPLPQLAQRAFCAHMTLHMMVVAVAAPLLALGLAGGRFDPVTRAPRWFAPLPLSLLELVVVWAWHAPALHHLARHHMAGLAAEQGSFFISGLWLWLAACGGTGGERQQRRAAGVVALLLTSMHMTLLGALFALAPRPLFAHGGGLYGMSPLTDQQAGGALMLLIGGVAYLAGGLKLMVELLRGAAFQPAPNLGNTGK